MHRGPRSSLVERRTSSRESKYSHRRGMVAGCNLEAQAAVVVRSLRLAEYSQEIVLGSLGRRYLVDMKRPVGLEQEHFADYFVEYCPGSRLNYYWEYCRNYLRELNCRCRDLNRSQLE